MTRLIIDTDPGIDDAYAIALACASPEVELIGVTTVFGNVGLADTTRNALRVLALCGREDVPVAAGADRPLVQPHPHLAVHVHGEDGLSGLADTLPERATGLAGVDAVSMLVRLLEESSEPVVIAPIGPLTNIALLLAAHPGVRSKIERLVVMGGGIDGGNVTAAAEFNVWSDPEAARRVLVEESVPVTLVPLDLTTRCAVDGAWLDRLGTSGAVGETLVRMSGTYREHYQQALGRDGIVIHDAVAVAEAVRPGILRTTRMPVDVDCGLGPSRGMTIGDRRDHRVRIYEAPREIDVALDADLDEVRAFLGSRLAGVH
ncbi:nucleoside hydrolase [Actinophytocola oryzae]|uniref:Pyrimidine-specific ribonucleoside hydrolase n=1 Tax=Actinophytocola oryzae TaxID=502181 RepID=A0A4R7VVL7_9PSEU|nr:nucleoside hydrolase [Actinophytocola oryzae]TDV54066.1 pyrimidine-specific ribonucleoside hydrolase [Actinophytocola oryzae]